MSVHVARSSHQSTLQQSLFFSSLLFNFSLLPSPAASACPAQGQGRASQYCEVSSQQRKHPRPTPTTTYCILLPLRQPARSSTSMCMLQLAGAACVGVAVSRLSSRVGVPVWWPLPLPCCVPLLPVLHLRCAPLLHSILVALQLRVARSHSRSLPLRLAETLTLCPCLYIHARPLSGHPFSSRPRPRLFLSACPNFSLRLVPRLPETPSLRRWCSLLLYIQTHTHKLARSLTGCERGRGKESFSSHLPIPPSLLLLLLLLARSPRSLVVFNLTQLFVLPLLPSVLPPPSPLPLPTAAPAALPLSRGTPRSLPGWCRPCLCKFFVS